MQEGLYDLLKKNIMPRKTAAKDANGGKLGQYTTEVKKTIKKAKEESAAFFTAKLKQIEAVHELEIKEAVYSATKKSFQSAFTKGFVTAAIPQRFYKYDLIGNTVFPMTSDWYLGGAALLGNKIWVKNLSTTGTVKWLYCLQSTSTNLRRIMIF